MRQKIMYFFIFLLVLFFLSIEIAMTEASEPEVEKLQVEFENVGYRALGTKNEKGWRGLGAKDSRIWDFGWQKTHKNNQEVEIRLLLHATDPVFGESRLGKVDSKGCIRVSGKLNKFLDRFGLLDQEYEINKDKKSIAWLLKSDREPSIFAGKYMLVGDSSKR